jgi:hypothetical protein
MTFNNSGKNNFETVKNSSDEEEASFEEESLIERRTQRSSGSGRSSSSCGKMSEGEKEEEDLEFLDSKSKVNNNIVEVIDPTFKQHRNKAGLIERKLSEIKVASGMAGSRSLSKYEACDEDTDTFLPVQGQRRGAALCKKKKSTGQCSQQ